MTFCLGINVHHGLVGLADTRITSGSECLTARKVTVFEETGMAIFVMTSGLRSVRDKAMTYFEEAIADRPEETDRLFKAANLFAQQVRRVAAEDKQALDDSGLHFNMHALIGGQLAGDTKHKLYLVYPQGNWVEIGKEGTPYHILGASGYGKPVMDRTLQYCDSMRMALKVGCLAFDSTRISAADVDYPVDIVLYERNSYHVVQHRVEKENLADMSTWWQDRLRSSVAELPAEWIEHVLFRAESGRPAREDAVRSLPVQK